MSPILLDLRAHGVQEESTGPSGVTVPARAFLATALAAASALLFGLAFPTVGLRPLAWVALVPYLIAPNSAD